MLKSALSLVTRRRVSPARHEDAAFHRTLTDSLINDLSRRLETTCELIDYRATRTGSLTVRVRADRSYVAKLPLQASTGPRLRLNAQALTLLGRLGWMTPFLADRCPVLVLISTASGYFYSVETALPGQDGASVLRTRANVDKLILSAERFILQLQKASLVDSEPTSALWEAPFQSAVERVARLAAYAGEAEGYQQMVSYVRTRLAAQPIPSVYSHGNFWLGNALFDAEDNLTGAIDWDCAAEYALPAIDLIYFLVRTHSLTRRVGFGEALADWIDAEALPFLDDCLTRHCRELSIPTTIIAPLSYCSWIQHLDAHCRFGTSASTNARWLSHNVRRVIHCWRRRARAGRVETGRWDSL